MAAVVPAEAGAVVAAVDVAVAGPAADVAARVVVDGAVVVRAVVAASAATAHMVAAAKVAAHVAAQGRTSAHARAAISSRT